MKPAPITSQKPPSPSCVCIVSGYTTAQTHSILKAHEMPFPRLLALLKEGGTEAESCIDPF